ncbi:AraC family transcriptional regulator [Microvenator marinus]|uniref:AraC family transcriptional regulator n=2 Tax=Microvenator marinus TaxID=2600177 RepID=A0A5B8XM01_9DELT|nr:AraC family transcriptional regulator [Microvenator marinus]
MKVWRQDKTIWIAGAIMDNQPHKHHAIQVIWADPSTDAILETSTEEFVGNCLLVESWVEHRLELESGLICLINAESDIANALRSRYPTKSARKIEGHLSTDFSLMGRESPIDERIINILSWLDQKEEERDWSEVEIEQALERVHLSKSRFLHLFSEEIGTPWRSYILWRRAIFAMELVLSGLSLTDASHASGYSDSAHFSRQFKDLFGYPPSLFSKVVEPIRE